MTERPPPSLSELDGYRAAECAGMLYLMMADSVPDEILSHVKIVFPAVKDWADFMWSAYGPS